MTNMNTKSIWGYESDETALMEALAANEKCSSINLGSAVADFGDREALALANALEKSPNSLIECNIFPVRHNYVLRSTSCTRKLNRDQNM